MINFKFLNRVLVGINMVTYLFLVFIIVMSFERLTFTIIGISTIISLLIVVGFAALNTHLENKPIHRF